MSPWIWGKDDNKVLHTMTYEKILIQMRDLSDPTTVLDYIDVMIRLKRSGVVPEANQHLVELFDNLVEAIQVNHKDKIPNALIFQLIRKVEIRGDLPDLSPKVKEFFTQYFEKPGNISALPENTAIELPLLF